MKRHAMPDMKEGGVNVTPLIDIVMCLIIFFMLVAKIGVSTGADTKIQIPETILGAKIDDLGNTLTLNIQPGVGEDPFVTALVGGEVKELKLVENRGGKPESPLVNVLTELRNRNKDFKVVIRGDKDMSYKYLEPVLQACSQANCANVNFNTKVVTVTQ
jgi:biopolymer transport protein ExbD